MKRKKQNKNKQQKHTNQTNTQVKASKEGFTAVITLMLMDIYKTNSTWDWKGLEKAMQNSLDSKQMAPASLTEAMAGMSMSM